MRRNCPNKTKGRAPAIRPLLALARAFVKLLIEMKKRIFAAIDISDEARRRAAEYTNALRRRFPDARVGWEKPEKLHLTLKFLGETDENQLNDLIEIVKKTAGQFSGFKLKISDTGVFPSPRRARVLWLGVDDENESLPQISEVLEAECEKIGFAKEKRNYKAHLTIARLREPHYSREIIQTHLQSVFEPVAFKVKEIVVYESELRQTGSIYTAISKSKLGKTKDGFDG